MLICFTRERNVTQLFLEIVLTDVITVPLMT